MVGVLQALKHAFELGVAIAVVIEKIVSNSLQFPQVRQAI